MPKGIKISDEQRERIRTMLLEGYAPDEIAVQEYISVKTIQNIRSKLPYVDKNRHSFPAGMLMDWDKTTTRIRSVMQKRGLSILLVPEEIE